MLALDTAEWSKLAHAYGPASDIPDLLHALELKTAPRTAYQAEPWYSLWSALCHQGDAYTASYAAVPHIVRICLNADPHIDFGFFQLPACIEIARAKKRGPNVPIALSAAYNDALRLLHACASKHSSVPWDDAMAQSVAAALAAAKGRTRLAEAIVNLDD